MHYYALLLKLHLKISNLSKIKKALIKIMTNIAEKL